MADTDRILKILLQLQSDVSGLKPIKSGLDDLTKSAFTLRDAFKFAGAEEGLRRTLDFIKDIPVQIGEGIKKGVEFSAQLQQIQSSIAGVLRQNAPDFFSDFAKANQTAAQAIDQLRVKANQLGIDYESMFEAYTHSVNAMFAGGVVDIQQQINLTATLSRALTSLGITANIQRRDIADLLTGAASRTIAGRQLAAGMGIDVTEFDRQINAANQAGQAWQFWTKALAGYQEAGQAASQNFNADIQRFKNSLLDLEQQAARPLMQPLQDAVRQLTESLRSGGGLVAVQELGGFVASLVSGFTALANNISGASSQLSQFASIASSLAGNPVLGFVLGGAGKSAAALTAGNVVADLSRQSQAAIDALGNARDINAAVAAQIALEQTNFAIKQQINQVDGVNRQQLQGQLTVNEQVLASLKQHVGSLQQITARHVDNKKALEAIKEVQDEIKLLQDQASGDKEAVAADRAALAYDKKLKSLLAAGVPEKEATAEAQKYRDAVEAAALAVDARKDANKDIVEFLQEESLLVQKIHDSQQLINQNSFLSIDEKQALTIPLISGEITELNAKIAQGRAMLAGGTLDPVQYDKVEKAVLNLDTRVKLLGLDLQKLSFGGGLQAELVSWVNQFGTAAHQVAGIITGTLNTAIAGTSQAITGLIFGTRNWQQAFAQAAQSIVQNIIQIALQFVVSRLVMAAINRITGATEGAAASAQAAASAAAWAPAAVSASIASYGAASAAGLAAYLSAIAAGEAGAVAVGGIGGAAGGGGFRSGGYTGEGDPSEIAGAAHKKEFYFTAEETAKLGLPFLRSLAKAAGGQAKFETTDLLGGVGRPGTGPGGTPGLPFGGYPPEYFGNRPGMGYTGPSPSTVSPIGTDDTDFLNTMPGVTPYRLGGIDITAGTGFTPRAGGQFGPAANVGGRDISLFDTSGRIGSGLFGPIGGSIAPGAGPTVYPTDWRSDPGGPVQEGRLPGADLSFGFFGTPGPRVGPNLGFGPGGLGGLTEDPHLSATQFAPFQTDFVAPGEGFDSDRTGAGRFRGARTMPALSSSRVPSRHLALGGLVDSIPAMLTPGEFVVRKPAVDHMGVEFLHALNSMQFPVRRLAAGGFIGDLAGTSSVSSSAQRDMHFNLFLDPNELRRHVFAHPDAEHRIEDLFSRKKLKFGFR